MSELSKNVGVVRAARNGTKVTVSSSKAELPLQRDPGIVVLYSEEVTCLYMIGWSIVEP